MRLAAISINNRGVRQQLDNSAFHVLLNKVTARLAAVGQKHTKLWF